MITHFINWCKYVRQHSDVTCMEYSKILGQFADYCFTHNISIQSFSDVDVNEWIISQTQRGVKAVTVNTRIICLRSFYGWACRFYGCTYNPFLEVRKLKVPKLLPKYIERATIMKALEANTGGGFYDVRARAIVAFLYMTGVRRAELINLHVTDVSRTGHYCRIFGKGRKERICPIPVALDFYLDEWERVRAFMIPSPSDYYWCASTGKSMSNTSVADVLHVIFDAFLPRHDAHPHSLRHSYATTLMQNGVPIVDIARLLGHASTQTTLRYLSLSTATQYNDTLNNIFV